MRWQLDELRAGRDSSGRGRAAFRYRLAREARVPPFAAGAGGNRSASRRRALRARRLRCDRRPSSIHGSKNKRQDWRRSSRVSRPGCCLRLYDETLDSDPGRLEAIESRLAVLMGSSTSTGARLIRRSRSIAGSSAARSDRRPRRRGRSRQAECEQRPCRPRGRPATLSEARRGGAKPDAEGRRRELDGSALEGARFEIALRPVAEIGQRR